MSTTPVHYLIVVVAIVAVAILSICVGSRRPLVSIIGCVAIVCVALLGLYLTDGLYLGGVAGKALERCQ